MEELNVFDVQIPDGRQISVYRIIRLLILILTIYVGYVLTHMTYMMWLTLKL